MTLFGAPPPAQQIPTLRRALRGLTVLALSLVLSAIPPQPGVFSILTTARKKRSSAGSEKTGNEVEPYRGLARYILAVFQKYAIFAQFWPTPLSLSLLKTRQTTIWFHFNRVGPVEGVELLHRSWDMGSSLNDLTAKKHSPPLRKTRNVDF